MKYRIVERTHYGSSHYTAEFKRWWYICWVSCYYNMHNDVCNYFSVEDAEQGIEKHHKEGTKVVKEYDK